MHVRVVGLVFGLVLAAAPALADGPPPGFQNAVPEPSAALAFGAGMLALRAVLRRR